jgi:hypothetical protein
VCLGWGRPLLYSVGGAVVGGRGGIIAMYISYSDGYMKTVRIYSNILERVHPSLLYIKCTLTPKPESVVLGAALIGTTRIKN